MKNSIEEFIVYGIESPTYPAYMFGGQTIALRSRPEFRLSGSALAIGAGHVKKHVGSLNECRISPLGVLAIGEWRLPQRVVTALVRPTDHVTIVYDTVATSNPSWVATAQNNGLGVIETEDAVVCMGKGRMLDSMNWLKSVHSLSMTCLIASRGLPSRLERLIIDEARSGANARALVDRFWTRALTDSGVIPEELEGYSLMTSIGGLEWSDVFVNQPDTNTETMTQVLRDVATDMGFILYDAGTVSSLEASGYFNGVEEWQSLPASWRRIV